MPIARVGQFNESFLPILDGVANVVKNYGQWLSQTGIECRVITPAFPSAEDNYCFDVIRYPSIPLPKRKPYRLGISQLKPNFIHQLAAEKFDLVHAHSPFSAGNLALKLAREYRIPSIATFHSKYYDDFKAAIYSERLAKYLTRRVVKFYQQFDHVWTVNHTTAETLYSYGYQGHIELINNGAEQSNLGDQTTTLERINQHFGLAASDFVFLFVGQHIWQKNVKLIIDSLAMLKQQGFQFNMLFVGQGDAASKMQQLTNSLALGNEIKFVGPIANKALLNELYSRANLFVFPSLYDTGPLVIREAAANACPSLVIRNSNTAEGIVDLDNGLLADNSTEDFTLKLIYAIQNPAALKQMGQHAKQTLFQDWRIIVEAVKLRYLAIIDSHRKKLHSS